MDHTKRTNETPYCLMPLLDESSALWFETSTAALLYQMTLDEPNDYAIQFRPKKGYKR